MFTASHKFIFYGIDNISEKLDDIIKRLDVKKEHFEIKLIMSEAITNAFIHGNNSDKSKPIVMVLEIEKGCLNIKVKDCGTNKENLNIFKDLDETSILEENGRGLYIISAYTDEVRFEDSYIVMKKSLS